MPAMANPGKCPVIWNGLGKQQDYDPSYNNNYSRKTSPNEEKKRMDTIVWNKAEKILEDAEAHVLELFDWYGTLPFISTVC